MRGLRLVALLGVLAMSVAAPGAPAGGMYDVRAFGAAGDGKTLDNSASMIRKGSPRPHATISRTARSKRD